MSSAEPGDVIDSLVVQFGDLQLSITVRNTGTGASGSTGCKLSLGPLQSSAW